MNIAVPSADRSKVIDILGSSDSIINESRIIKGLIVMAVDIDEGTAALLTLMYGKENVWNR